MNKFRNISILILCLYLLFDIHFYSLESIYYNFVGEEKLSSKIPVYVINLDRSTERYAKIKAQLDKYGVEHKRFSAVDGYKIKIENLKTHDIFTGQDLKDGVKKIDLSTNHKIYCPNFAITYVPKHMKYHIAGALTAGEFGLYCSHMEIWNEVRNKNFPYALIFEDDAELRANFGQKLDTLVRNLPDFSWDMLLLFFWERKKTRSIGNGIVELVKDGKAFSSSAAYLVSYYGAHNLFDQLQFFSIPIDNEIASRINQGKASVLALQRFIAYTSISDLNTEESTIHNMGRIFQ